MRCPSSTAMARCAESCRAATSSARSPRTSTRPPHSTWRSRRRLLDPGDTLEHALECLAAAGTSLPVFDEDDGLVGWLGDQDVLRVYLRRAPATGAALAPAAS